MPKGLSLAGITVRFGGLVALDGVSLEVATAGVVGVIGPNGAGKTTLFNVVCGFVRPNQGTMTWQDGPFAPKPADLTRLGIARTLQGIGLFAGLTVEENVMAGAASAAKAGFTSALLGLSRSDTDERRLRDLAREQLDRIGIARYAGASPATLPFAIRKKVALARALISQPRLLLLDEPASGLAPDEIDELAALITGMRTERAIMLVEHHMDLVMQVCDAIVVLDFGRVIARGGPQEIRDNPAVADAYLGTDAGSPEAEVPA